jgi:hypothetical protein
MNWMLFHGPGVSPEHFFFNGEYPPINVSPGSEQKTIWKTEESAHEWAQSVKVLEEALLNSRKKFFIIRKQRYTVVARGKFVGDDG